MKKFIILLILSLVLVNCASEEVVIDPVIELPVVEEILEEIEPIIPVVEESDFALYGNLNVELYDTDENGDPILIDDGPYDGYRWGDMRPMAWIPGMITEESYNMLPPEVFSGKLGAAYEPNTLGTASYLEGYLGAVELPVCGANGQSAWINRGGGWEGPYLIVGCAKMGNTYGQIVHEEVVIKISFEVAMDWGMAYLWQTEHIKRLGDKHVHKTVRQEMQARDEVIRSGWHYTVIDDVRISLIDPEEISEDSVNLKEYFLDLVRFQVGG